MNRRIIRFFGIITVCALLIALLPTALAEEKGTGFYMDENGVYSFELAADGICYWYQYGERYAGRYETTETAYSMKLTGSGSASDTGFTAERMDDGSLLVSGGMVTGQRFTESEKLPEMTDIDRTWAARIRKSRPSNGGISLAETILMDWNGIRITAREYTPNGNEEEIELWIENHSSDDVTLFIDDLRINNIGADVPFYQSLAPNEAHWTTLRLNVPTLEAAGISRVESVTASFSVQEEYQTVFVSEPTMIPVQDRRNRVPVLIPIRKNLLSFDNLSVDLVGYENQGSFLYFYFFVRNDSAAGFEIKGENVFLNGESCSPYAVMDIKGSAAAVYSMSVNNAEYSGIGKLRQLELDLVFVEGYIHPFGEIQKLHMEFEKDGQLCGFGSGARMDTESEFWQEYFALPAENVPEELSGFSRDELDAAIDLFKNYDLEEDRVK